MKREDLVSQTRRLIEEGDRIDRSPSRAALNTWLAASDALLSEAWGSMDRYHLAWLEVGRIAQPLRGREIRITCTKRHMDLLAARVHCSPPLTPRAKRRRRTKTTRSTGRVRRRRATARTSGKTN